MTHVMVKTSVESEKKNKKKKKKTCYDCKICPHPIKISPPSELTNHF